jgi:hypothetical protein
MTRQDLLHAIYDEHQYDQPPTLVERRIGRFLAEGIRMVLAEPGMDGLQDTDAPFTVSSVASQARYAIPEGIARIAHVSERTNDRRLEVLSLARYRRIAPDPTVTGSPTHYVPIGRVGVAVQPSNASEIFIDSTSASDTNTAFLTGRITGGYERTISVTMTGTTAVSVSSAITTFVELHDVYLSHPAIGTVTLHEDASGGTELARITIGAKQPHYYGFYLWPTPASVIDYLVDGKRSSPPFVNNSQEPPWPAEFHELLVAYGAYREWLVKNDTTRASEAKARADRWLSRLKYWTQAQTDETFVLRAAPRVGISRLGADFPVDTWVG